MDVVCLVCGGEMDCKDLPERCVDLELACPWCDGVASEIDETVDTGLVAQELRWNRPFARRPLPKMFDDPPAWDYEGLTEAEAV
jgi:hypothetical protein